MIDFKDTESKIDLELRFEMFKTITPYNDSQYQSHLGILVVLTYYWLTYYLFIEWGKIRA